MKLHELTTTKGARATGKRVGRGEGSGLGKTAGRGQKGQKSRSGVSLGGFEGGQNPLYRRLPKRGFTNIFAKKIETVNLKVLQSALDRGVIAEKTELSTEKLLELGLVRKKFDAIKFLGDHVLTKPLKIPAGFIFSAGAKNALEKAKCEISS